MVNLLSENHLLYLVHEVANLVNGFELGGTFIGVPSNMYDGVSMSLKL